MANRNFNPTAALEKEVKHLFAEVAVGATGAPTLSSGLGVASITRNGAGDYTVTLDDAYNKLLSAHISLEAASAEDLTFQLAAVDTSASAKTIQFLCKAAAVNTDPSDGAVLRLHFVVRNTNIGPA